MATKRFVIFTSLWPEDLMPGAMPEFGPEDFIACADGGYILCKSAGIRPDVVMGDFDSLSEELIREIDSLGIERVVFSSEKDDTDTMLCVKHGVALGYERFLIVGGIGGDFGHTMANVQALSFLMDLQCSAEIVTNTERIFLADGETRSVHREPSPAIPVSFTGRKGECFSVLSCAERSSGVFVKNAKYELSDAVVTHSYPIGISNEFINSEPVTVSVRYGRLLIITERQL